MARTFQIVDISSDDYEGPDGTEFVVSLYGIERNGDRLVCHVRKFRPYFFVKVPDGWSKATGKTFIRDVSTFWNKTPQRLGKRSHLHEIHQLSVVTECDFYGCHYIPEMKRVKPYQFLKIVCSTHRAMKEIVQAIKDYYGSNMKASVKTPLCTEWFGVDTTLNCDSNLYEAGLPPVIRFIHDSHIDPTGWVTVQPSPTSQALDTGLFSTELTVIFTLKGSIQKHDTHETSPYIIASFDIECDSSHGDFPQATKDFKKLATDVYDSYRKMYQKVPPTVRSRVAEQMETHIANLLKMGFEEPVVQTGLYAPTDINHVYVVNDAIPTPGSIETVIYFLTELIDKENKFSFALETPDKENKQRDSNINQFNTLLTKYLKDSEKRPLVVKGDPVIQIGTVFHTYGTDIYERHIVVIGPQDNMKEEDICDLLDENDIEVKRCATETELFITWSDTMKAMDPDFVTGYNIFGFDFKYLKERAKVLLECPKHLGGQYQGKSKCNRFGHHSTCPSHRFYNLGKIQMGTSAFYSKKCEFKTKALNSSAFGENALSYITMDGRILFDIQIEVQKSHNLDSYKLDDVASHFMRGKIQDIQGIALVTDGIGNLKVGDFISFRTHSNIGELLHEQGRKFKIVTIQGTELTLQEPLVLALHAFHKVEWCLNKDDITPQEIFEYHQSTGEDAPAKRAKVAKYCIQDCELCINLLLLLDLIPNNLAMANVSYVPASYIFLRGQGIKVTSVVTRVCNTERTRVPDLKKLPLMRDYVKIYKHAGTDAVLLQDIEKTKQSIEEQEGKGSPHVTMADELYGALGAHSLRENYLETNVKLHMIEDGGWRCPKDYELDEWWTEVSDIALDQKGMMGYEGAVVLEPKPGIYLSDPIAVMDYASLYPSSIIEKNISHETQIEDMVLLASLDPMDYYTITYENWVYRLKGKGNTVEKVLDTTSGEKKCYFLKPSVTGTIGIIPKVLEHLLKARKATKKRMKSETNEYKYKVLDGLQLAYKVTANSVYGQLGARTSTIFKMNLAACTTRIGRERIEDASRGVQDWAIYRGVPAPEVVYGDTDSVFVKFSRIKNGVPLKGKEALQYCIECGQDAGDFITKQINAKEQHSIQVLEYEKTFWPFILISKKRYTGDKYEFNTDTCKRDSMGIVLKRRDNAPIVKHVFGNIIELIMTERDFAKAQEWYQTTQQQIREGMFDLPYFVISKALRGYYKNPHQIAHKVLADRMGEREPGNKPKSNDRIPYAYIQQAPPDIVGYKYKVIRNKVDDGFYKNGKPKTKVVTTRVQDTPIYDKRKILQGDRIEHVDYIRSHPDIVLDYEFYLTNQIHNPVNQVLELSMDP